jgi:hypothetical protein
MISVALRVALSRQARRALTWSVSWSATWSVGCGFAQGGEEGGEQEFDERSGVAEAVAGGEHRVVVGLAVTDDGFDRKPCEQRIPAAEDKSLPKATDASIAVAERVDEFEFVIGRRSWR